MIRPIKDSDIEKIMDIENECFFHPWKKEEFVFEMSDPTCFFYVVEEDDIVGYIDYHLIGDFVELFNIAVTKEKQGKGYGQMMLDYMFENCKGKADKIFLEVRINNPAKNLYMKNGFVENRIRKNYYPDGDAIEMYKELK